MAEHSELVGEMPIVERMATQDRLKHAKKRRAYQLKKWGQREKADNNKRKRAGSNEERTPRKCFFAPNVVLLEAAARNDIDEVRKLLEIRINPNSCNEDGLTPLHQCCIDNCPEMMQLLVSFGADVNARDTELWTPLHAAATCGHLHLVKFLIHQGADLLAVNSDGNMPYDICEDDATLSFIENVMSEQGVTQELIDDCRVERQRNFLADVRQHVEQGDVNDYHDLTGASLLHIAAANGYLDVAEFLLDNGASVSCEDDDGWQPIHAAACWGQLPVAALLLSHGSGLDCRTYNFETPLELCDDVDIKEKLLEMKSRLIENKLMNNTLLRRHSSSRRSQSIRRSSIREKSAMSRREARAEAVYRQVNPNETPNNGSKQQQKPLSTDEITLVPVQTDLQHPHPPDNSNQIPAENHRSILKPPQILVGVEGTGGATHYIDQCETTTIGANNDTNPNSPPLTPVKRDIKIIKRPSKSSGKDSDHHLSVNKTSDVRKLHGHSSFGSRDVKKDIHNNELHEFDVMLQKQQQNIEVDFNSPPGTLAELKRKRAQNTLHGQLSQNEYIPTDGSIVVETLPCVDSFEPKHERASHSRHTPATTNDNKFKIQSDRERERNVFYTASVPERGDEDGPGVRYNSGRVDITHPPSSSNGHKHKKCCVIM